MRSMTGFGQASSESQLCRVSVTVRTVNHKFLDIALRLPEEYRQYEARARELIGGHLTRGRVDLRVDVDDHRSRKTRIELNQELIDQLLAAVRQWEEVGITVGELTIRDLIRVPDAIRFDTDLDEADPEMVDQVLSTLEQGLRQTDEARQLEGRKLSSKISGLVDDMAAKVDQIDRHESEVSKQLADRFRERLEGLDRGEVLIDESRVAQEVALLIERTDIREELDRLRTHIDHFKTAAHQDGPVGRRLDFLAQEMFRELNTLATKCRHTSVIQAAIDGKLICEQIREQVLNLE